MIRALSSRVFFIPLSFFSVPFEPMLDALSGLTELLSLSGEAESRAERRLSQRLKRRKTQVTVIRRLKLGSRLLQRGV
jgi:hypothetical protein